MFYPSGTHIIDFPQNKGSFILRSDLADIGVQILENEFHLRPIDPRDSFDKKQKALLANLRTAPDPKHPYPSRALIGVSSSGSLTATTGNIAVVGDSNCIDSMHVAKSEFWFWSFAHEKNTEETDFSVQMIVSWLLSSWEEIWRLTI